MRIRLPAKIGTMPGTILTFDSMPYEKEFHQVWEDKWIYNLKTPEKVKKWVYIDRIEKDESGKIVRVFCNL